MQRTRRARAGAAWPMADTGEVMTPSDPSRGATYRARPAAITDPESLSPTLRRRRALTLLGLTLVAPGSAQIVAGNRRVGQIAVRVWLSVLLGAAFFGLLALLRRSVVLALFTRSWFLTALTVLLVVLALGWAALFLDTVRLGRLRLVQTPTRRLVAILTATSVLVTSGGLLYAASLVNAGRSLIGTVFGSTTSTEATDDRFNILLLGGDSGKDRTGTRPDSINLVSVDVTTGKAVMFGFARNTENIVFEPGSTMAGLMPQGWTCGDECLLNALYTWGVDHRKEFPPGTDDPGVLATTEAVEALSGLDVHYYVLVDLKGFQSLVDAVGGLTLNVKRRTPIGGIGSPINGYIEPGVQHLDGFHALWYARSRVGSEDYERMARQRCVLNAMAQQLNPRTVLTKLPAIAAATGRVLKTDIPEQDLGALAELALRARSQPIKSVNFVPPLMKPWDYDPAFIHATVTKTIEQSRQPAVKASTSRPSSTTPKPTATTQNDLEKTKGQPTEDDLTSVCGTVS